MKNSHLKALAIMSILSLGCLRTYCQSPQAVTGYDISLDGIYYRLKGDSAIVVYDTSFLGGTGRNPSYSSRTSISIPNVISANNQTYQVRTIGARAFFNCQVLKTISIPRSITAIGANAFQGCSVLDSVVSYIRMPFAIDESVFFESGSYIHNVGAPSRMPSNAVLYVPSGTKALYEKTEGWNQFISIVEMPLTDGDTFIACTEEGIELKFQVISSSEKTCEVSGLKDYSYRITGGTITIPSEVNSFHVVAIGDYAFGKCNNISIVKIPDTVKSIGNSAFSYCSSLSAINLSNNIITIGADAFCGCESLKSIVIPSSVTSIGMGAAGASNPFQYCSSLERIVVETGNTVYDSRDNCNAIIQKSVPTTPQDYGTLITGCKNTIIPSSVQAIGDYAFAGMGLTHIEIPGNVHDNIPNNAFLDNYIEREHIITHDGLNPDFLAHCGCTILDTSIEDGFYISNGKLLKYTGDDTTIVIPNIVTSIGNNVFSGRTDITSVTIPNTIIEIGSGVFQGCSSLASITIPNKVKSIGSYAFLGCDALVDIYNYAFTPQQITSNTFPNLTATLHVVKNYKEAFESAEYWKEFSNIVGDLDQTGVCGENAIYSLDTETGVLAISGTGKMYDYNWNSAPWYSNRQYIKSIEISEGITSIGNNAFYDCTGMTSITVPGSIVSIGNNALWNNSSLTSIILPDNIEFMGYSALPNNIWIGTKRGTKTLLVLWKNNYTPFDIGAMTPAGIPPLESPFLTLSSATQTTATCKINNIYEEYSYEYRNYYIDSAFHPVSGSEFKMTGLIPEMSQTVWLSVSKDGICYETSFNLVTKRIERSVTIDSTTASSISAQGYYAAGDAVVSKQTIALCSMKETTSSDNAAYYTTFSRSVKGDRGQTINYYKNFYLIGDTPPCEGKSAAFYGLNPSTEYYVVYSLFVELASISYQYSAWTVEHTQSLSLTTQQPKVISLGNVIVGAESNLDDAEENVGFEWRRIDWTDDFRSNTGEAYLYNGMMEGYIRNLYTEKLWKYRPYYESNAGNRYTGEWVGIDPTNTSYFEPTVHTYATVSVQDNRAEIKGYAMRGTDNLMTQGFKYWKTEAGVKAASDGPRRIAVPTDALTVEAKGNIMTAILTDLDDDTEYGYVAFVTTSEGETFYGEQQTFRTGLSQAAIDGINETIHAQPSMPKVQSIYDLSGRKLSSTQKGINIIRMSDGTTRKVYQASPGKN